MITQIFIQRNAQNNKAFIIGFPESDDPFKRPENDRVKALRFSGLTAPDGLSGLTAPYCPIAPTLWRRNLDESDSETEPVNRKSSLRKVLFSSISTSNPVCLTFSKHKNFLDDSEPTYDNRILTTSTDSSQGAAYVQYASIWLPSSDTLWSGNRPEHVHQHPGRAP